MTLFAIRSRLVRSIVMRTIGCITIAVLTGCSPQPPAGQPSGPSPGAGTGAALADILVVEQSELDAVRAKYVLSEPRGDVAATATCESGQADKACTDAARQQLRDEAKKHGATLVVITSSALRQTYPPQLALRGTLYDIRPR